MKTKNKFSVLAITLIIASLLFTYIQFVFDPILSSLCQNRVRQFLESRSQTQTAKDIINNQSEDMEHGAESKEFTKRNESTQSLESPKASFLAGLIIEFEIKYYTIDLKNITRNITGTKINYGNVAYYPTKQTPSFTFYMYWKTNSIVFFKRKINQDSDVSYTNVNLLKVMIEGVIEETLQKFDGPTIDSFLNYTRSVQDKVMEDKLIGKFTQESVIKVLIEFINNLSDQNQSQDQTVFDNMLQVTKFFIEDNYNLILRNKTFYQYKNEIPTYMTSFNYHSDFEYLHPVPTIYKIPGLDSLQWKLKTRIGKAVSTYFPQELWYSYAHDLFPNCEDVLGTFNLQIKQVQTSSEFSSTITSEKDLVEDTSSIDVYHPFGIPINFTLAFNLNAKMPNKDHYGKLRNVSVPYAWTAVHLRQFPTGILEQLSNLQKRRTLTYSIFTTFGIMLLLMAMIVTCMVMYVKLQ